MIAKQLKNIFDTYIELDVRVWENFEKIGKTGNYPKGYVLKEPYATEKYLNIVIEGCGGNLIWKKNNFVCIDIVSKGEFLCDYMSFVLQEQTPIEVKLFNDSTLFQISHTNFQNLLTLGPHGESITKVIADAAFIAKQKQQIALLTKSAKERYLELISNKKGIERTSLKYIASYLGITPQSLSRIRADKV